MPWNRCSNLAGSLEFVEFAVSCIEAFLEGGHVRGSMVVTDCHDMHEYPFEILDFT